MELLIDLQIPIKFEAKVGIWQLNLQCSGFLAVMIGTTYLSPWLGFWPKDVPLFPLASKNLKNWLKGWPQKIIVGIYH